MGRKRRNVRTLLLLPLLIAQTLSAHATVYFQTGNELFALCNDRTQQQRAFCIGAVSGYSDMLNLIGETCADKHVTQGQASDVVLKFLGLHPELRHFGAASLARTALREAFPCRNK